jgi:hypothetical protein
VVDERRSRAEAQRKVLVQEHPRDVGLALWRASRALEHLLYVPEVAICRVGYFLHLSVSLLKCHVSVSIAIVTTTLSKHVRIRLNRGYGQKAW